MCCPQNRALYSPRAQRHGRRPTTRRWRAAGKITSLRFSSVHLLLAMDGSKDTAARKGQTALQNWRYLVKLLWSRQIATNGTRKEGWRHNWYHTKSQLLRERNYKNSAQKDEVHADVGNSYGRNCQRFPRYGSTCRLHFDSLWQSLSRPDHFCGKRRDEATTRKFLQFLLFLL
jgi:hypothetical protein